MVVVASTLLGLVFLVAGATKVAAPSQWGAQSAELGVPVVVGRIVPYLELAVGAMLVAQIGRRPVAVVAAAMLVAFTALLIVRLRQGRRPPCACFGGLTPQPIGWTNVARNAVFLALALVIVIAA